MRSQHCHSWSFTRTGVLTDSLLTVQTECTINEAVLISFPLFFSLFNVFVTPDWTACSSVLYVPCVCVCAMGGNDTCEPLGYKWQLSITVYFFSFSSLQQMSVPGGAKKQSICFTLLILWGVLLTSSAHVRIEDCIHSMYSFFSLNPRLGPSRLFLHSNSNLYLQDESPQQNRSAMFDNVYNLHNGFVDKMHAEHQ